MVRPAVNGRIPLLVIMGPTAVGKTAVAVDVAARIGGEIVSADSMQVYRGLDIGTAKPAPHELEAVPHHLVNVVDPGEEFSVARFKAMADAAIQDIWRRRRVPLLVGGTGLYIRAVIEGLPVDRVPPDWDYRRRLRCIAARTGRGHLHSCLERLDPESASQIHPEDLKRVIRALEMYRMTGQPRQSALSADEGAPYDPLKVVLFLAREQLYRRIDARVDAMMEAGWEDEVRRLLRMGLRRWLTSPQALGYRVLADAVEGRRGRHCAVEFIKKQTRRYAKRQLTWFRREQGAEWVMAGTGAAPYIARLAAGKWPAPANPS